MGFLGAFPSVVVVLVADAGWRWELPRARLGFAQRRWAGGEGPGAR
jgi:hypothetical protein